MYSIAVVNLSEVLRRRSVHPGATGPLVNADKAQRPKPSPLGRPTTAGGHAVKNSPRDGVPRPCSPHWRTAYTKTKEGRGSPGSPCYEHITFLLHCVDPFLKRIKTHHISVQVFPAASRYSGIFFARSANRLQQTMAPRRLQPIHV